MTKEEVKDRAENLLGVEHLSRYEAKWHVVFDKHTPNVQILPDFKLHDFLTKNKGETRTRIDVKILAAIQNVNDQFKKHPLYRPLIIMETFVYPHQRCAFLTDDRMKECFQNGWAIAFRVQQTGDAQRRRLRHRALQLATKLVYRQAGGRFIYKDYIILDSLWAKYYYERW